MVPSATAFHVSTTTARFTESFSVRATLPAIFAAVSTAASCARAWSRRMVLFSGALLRLVCWPISYAWQADGYITDFIRLADTNAGVILAVTVGVVGFIIQELMSEDSMEIEGE